MNIENIQAQMRKGILEYCVLSIIARGEMYPSDILKTLKIAKLIVVEGTLYPLLNRVKDEGLLTYQWVESKSGPPRKYYQLTSEGKKLLHELKKTWGELAAAVNHISNNHE